MNSNRQLSTVYRALRAYFRSGWAFFIPYLAAYLLYAWLKWPVNPATDGEGIVKGISEGVGAVSATLSTVSPSTGPASLLPRSLIPPLLHVYWALHAIHLILGAIAVRSWLRQTSLPPSPFSLLQKAAPWFCLMLLFYIPGAYLELPADPWAHLVRTNEWLSVQQVTQHSTWLKSSYFLPYSLTGHTYGLSQLTCLNFYHTGICLLLSWQYYRLARAVGLGERASFVFVLLNAVTFGNNIFSFYRYYGLSSSILAQLGAVALTRIVLEFAAKGTILHAQFGHKEAQKVAKKIPDKAVAPGPLGEPALSLPAVGQSNRPKGYSLLRSAALLLIPCSLLLVFTLFNHIQGLGIAGLGVLAVVVWRLIEWKRAMIFWLAGAAVVLSIATVLWFPRHPALDEIYRPQGWLSAWYGFNLFSINSPALERSWQILGAFGVANLGLALWLVARKNHVAGWLTLMPIVSLLLPFIAIPLANALSQHNADPANIITYHRMFFAIPSGLAIVIIGSGLCAPVRIEGHPLPAMESSPRNHLGVGPKAVGILMPVVLSLLIITPAQPPSFNRLYHVLAMTPADLDMPRFTKIIDAIAPHIPLSGVESVDLAIGESVYARRTRVSLPGILRPFQLASYMSATRPLTDILVFLRYLPNAVFVPQNGRELYTPGSMAGYLSGHWRPQMVAIGAMGGHEFERNATNLGYQELGVESPRVYIYQPAKADPLHP